MEYSQNTLTYVANLHQKEKQRVASLKNTQLLDSAPSQRFDKITNLVSDIFETPIALVSLIDAERQWFLSNCGMDVSETSRDVAFCAHAIHEDEIMVVEDVGNHDIFKDNPLVTGDPFIQFYAGAVIRDDNQLPLGTLCIIDTKPRKFNNKAQRQLIGFAQLIRQEMLGTDNLAEERTHRTFKTNKDPITNTLWGDAFFKSVERYRDSADEQTRFLTICADIVNFDTLNNAYGRMVGDQVIWEICRRLRHSLVGIGTSFVGRLDTKQLAVFSSLDNQMTAPVLEQKLSQIASSLAETISTQMADIQPQINIMYTIESSQDTVFKESARLTQLIINQVALKKSGVNISEVTKEAKALIARKFDLAGDLIKAIKSDQLHLVYQPKVSCNGGEIIGLECLLRWQHPRHGFVSPLDIFECADGTNSTLNLEKWIFKTAFAQVAIWSKLGITVPKLSINLTGETLTDSNFYDYISSCLNRYSLNARNFDIEILESSVFHDKEGGLAAIQRLFETGISFSLDDFGTGFSNLSYLKTMPISSLKIDMSFVRDITEIPQSASLCNSIISMARDLGMYSVAEGVETAEQLNGLKNMGCDVIQGYYFYKPMPAAEIQTILMSAE